MGITGIRAFRKVGLTFAANSSAGRLGQLAPVVVSIASTASSNDPRATSKAKPSRSPCESPLGRFRSPSSEKTLSSPRAR
jgi:hypothetical protein